MTFIRIVSGFLLAITLAVASASAEPAKLIFTTLAAPDSRAAAAVFHPFAERINTAGRDVVQLDVRDGFALANFDNAYSRVMDDVIQVSWALQGAIGGKFVRSAIAGLPFVSDDCERASTAFWRLYQSGALGPEYADIVPLVLIAFPQSGIHLSRPVATMDDLKGLKLIALGRIQSQVVRRSVARHSPSPAPKSMRRSSAAPPTARSRRGRPSSHSASGR